MSSNPDIDRISLANKITEASTDIYFTQGLGFWSNIDWDSLPENTFIRTPEALYLQIKINLSEIHSAFDGIYLYQYMVFPKVMGYFCMASSFSAHMRFTKATTNPPAGAVLKSRSGLINTTELLNALNLTAQSPVRRIYIPNVNYGFVNGANSLFLNTDGSLEATSFTPNSFNVPVGTRFYGMIPIPFRFEAITLNSYDYFNWSGFSNSLLDWPDLRVTVPGYTSSRWLQVVTDMRNLKGYIRNAFPESALR